MSIFEHVADSTFTEMDVSEKVETNLERLVKAFPHVEAKYEHIRNCDMLTDGMAEELRRQIDVVRSQRDEYQTHIGHLNRQLEHLPNPDPTSVKKLANWQAKIERCRTTIAELRERRKTMPAQFRRESIDKWLARLPRDAAFRPHIVKVPSKIDAALKALELNRAARQDFLQTRRSFEIAPLTFKEAYDQGVAQIQALARAGRPHTTALYHRPKDIGGRRRQGKIRWATKSVHGTLDPETDAFATFVWLNEASLLAAIESELKDKMPSGTVPAADRGPIIEDLNKRLFALEFEEEALVSAIEGSGRHNVARRADVSIEAVLQIELGDSTAESVDDFDFNIPDSADDK